MPSLNDNSSSCGGNLQCGTSCTYNCVMQLKRKLVRIGCGAGFAGDRPSAALKLLLTVPDMDYLVLECLAERTLAIRHEAMLAGGTGYDPRISDWMQLLLSEAVKRGVCIVTNMGAMDAEGAREEVLSIARMSHLNVSVGVVSEVFPELGESKPGSSTYLGAAPLVKLLELSKPNVIITTRLADASLFLGPMVYELGWNWDDFHKLSQGALAGHLLECGCQITGGYFAHPADEHRQLAVQQLLDVSLPYAQIKDTGEVIICKPGHTGGELSIATCSQQLLYEVGDPSMYVTPDVVVDFTNVAFEVMTEHQVLARGVMPGIQLRPERLLRLVPQDCGWKAWGEISYGGMGCIQRAKMAESMVLAWMEETCHESSKRVIGYLIGVDSLLISPHHPNATDALDIRLRMDGLFDTKEQAVWFTREFEALYTNGPAGGGGISVGFKKEVLLNKILVPRERTFWKVNTKAVNFATSTDLSNGPVPHLEPPSDRVLVPTAPTLQRPDIAKMLPLPAPVGVKLPLYKVAHCRAGDKGNDVNFSVIPHYAGDLVRLKSVITKGWVRKVTAHLFDHHCQTIPSSIRGDEQEAQESEHAIGVDIYEAQGIHALNIVVRDALDGGVTCSRRIDRHGKSLSDLILCQMISLPAEPK